MDRRTVENLLSVLPDKHVRALVGHFLDVVSEFQRGRWEHSAAKAGKFVEAVLKALWVSTGNSIPAGRAFKADTVINGLGNLPAGSHDDTIRLLIPRACRFVYDIASNRGGRHDPDEIDPNEMDAATLVADCSWVLAEMIRHAQRGKIDLTHAKRVVDALVEKKYPLVERVDGRVYFHQGWKSALDVALMALGEVYPERLSRDEIVDLVMRHGFRSANAHKAAERVSRLADDDGQGRLRLLAPGLQKAEQLLAGIPGQDRRHVRRGKRTK